MALHPLTLIASSDDYLLELERSDLVQEWLAAHPDGELRQLDPAPPADTLIRELVSRSLFSTDRLIVVANAAPYFTGPGRDKAAVETLVKDLAQLTFSDVTLLLTAVTDGEVKGALVDVIRERGEARLLPLPPAPKPWEDVRVSPAQRKVLERVLRRAAPEVLSHPEAVDALCETYGFHARELAQAAQRLALAGEISAAAVRQQAGPGECSLGQLEDALRDRDAGALARALAVVGAGGTLLGWRGETVDSDRVGGVVAGHLSRLLRQALAMRAHARRCGLTAELDPARCAGSGWYPRTFKPRLHARLEKDIADTADSPLTGRSAWALHHAFRLAAAYGDEELLEGLADLGASGAERQPPRTALVTLTRAFLALAAGSRPISA